MSEIGGSNGVRLQRRAQRKDGWTKAKRTQFLSVLAATCNATMAARAVGKAEATARDLRKRDGMFARLWQEALEVGHERLEGELVARALGLTPNAGDNPDLLPDAAIEAVAFDPVLAMKVIELRAKGAIGGPARGGRSMRLSQAEIDHELLLRLDRLAKRRGA